MKNDIIKDYMIDSHEKGNRCNWRMSVVRASSKRDAVDIYRHDNKGQVVDDCILYIPWTEPANESEESYYI